MTKKELIEKLRATESSVSSTLRVDYLDVNGEAGSCSLQYDIGNEFTSALGMVSAGIVSAMLDDALSTAGALLSGLDKRMITLESTIQFAKSPPPGIFRAEGRTLSINDKEAELESEVFDAFGELVARATATAVQVSIPG
ncbi:MAG: PaaI family thioesterase [Halioglobus sp.]